MTIKELEALLPRFTGLVGAYVDEYKSTIERVFVGFTIGDLTWMVLVSPIPMNINSVKPLPSDEYTICVLFDNKTLMGIKELVENVNMVDLLEVVNPLKYMSSVMSPHNPTLHEDEKP